MPDDSDVLKDIDAKSQEQLRRDIEAIEMRIAVRILTLIAKVLAVFLVILGIGGVLSWNQLVEASKSAAIAKLSSDEMKAELRQEVRGRFHADLIELQSDLADAKRRLGTQESVCLMALSGALDDALTKLKKIEESKARK